MEFDAIVQRLRRRDGGKTLKRGTIMKRSLGVILIVVMSSQMMGCSQGTAGPDWTLLSNRLGGPSEVTHTKAAASAPADLHAPTIANKTLSAIVLERATGLKPEPSRLVKFD